MPTMSATNVRANKATGAGTKKESGKTLSPSARRALKLPNKESLVALAEMAAGNVKRFDSVDDMMAYLKNADS